MAGKSYSSSSPFSSGYSGAKTTSSKKSSSSNTNNRERGADRNRSQTVSSSVKNKNTTSLNIANQKKDAEAFKNYSYQKPSGLGKFSPLVQFMDITGIGKKTFELNKSYYEKNVIGKINPATGKAYSANINEYQNYLKGRNAGTIDAMGRTIVRGDGGGDQMQTQTPPIQPLQTTVLETEEEKKKKKRSALGIGYGGSQKTILSSVIGDETEANVSKTILGGGIKA